MKLNIVLMVAVGLLMSGCGDSAGLNSLIKLVSSAPTCSGGGITIITALDINRSGAVELDADANIQMGVVCNGASAQGVFSNVEILDPCGDAPGVVDEVLLRLADGRVLASFSDTQAGDNTRFSLIGAGTYRTTDGSNCQFTLTSDGRLE